MEYFDKDLMNSWENEMRPFILQKFPIVKNGLFKLNSDFEYLIKVIDKLKKKYSYEKVSKKNKDININNNLNINNTLNEKEKNNIKENNEKKSKDKDNKNNEEDIHHNSIGFFKNEKRTSTQIEDEIISYKKVQNEKISEDIKNKNDKDKEEEDIKKSRKKNISKIYFFLQEFIQENSEEHKRSNSMINLRNHSKTVTSNTTCDSSIIEDNNLNINKIISKNNDFDLNSNININNESNKNSNCINDKNSNNLFGNIFMEEKKTEKESKVRSLIRSKSNALLREMTPFFKDEVQIEGKTIIFKMPEKTISYIFPDILLQKIINEDFISKNIILIHHLCQQCFSFVNKEIFFRKIFDCYKFYKSNAPIQKIYNLIEFINILIVEMFEYYQKINLKDMYVTHIKKFYNDLIIDLIKSLDNDENQENNYFYQFENNNKQFRFESIDYLNNYYNDNINSQNNNYNCSINKETLINMNLNFEVKNINIFVYKEKEEEKKDEKKENETFISPKTLSKSLPLGKSLSPQILKSSILLNQKLNKDFQEDNIEEKVENKNEKSKENNNKENINKEDNKHSVTFKEGSILSSEPTEEKEEDLKLAIEEEPKIEKDKKQKLFQISKTIRKSQVISIKNILKDAILEEDEELKEKSGEEEKSINELYSDKSIKDLDNIESVSSHSESEKENNKKKEITNKSLNLKKKISKEIMEKEKEREKKEEEEKKQKSELVKNILETTNLSEKLININEKILNKLQYILYLFDKENNGEPTFQEIKEAKDNINFYKDLKKIKMKSKKQYILPIESQKRLSKSYSFFSSISIKFKSNSREYLNKGYFCVTDWSIEDIGGQLMKVSKSLLNKICPRELYRAIYLKKEKDVTSPNVVDCIKKFNRLTSFIIEDILSYDYPKDRAKIYERWVLIADFCKLNKDFNDLIAIYSALNHYIITGLKLTLKEVRYKTNSMFKRISDFCTCEGNYKNIRDDMNNCEKTGEIFIPYLGMLLRDINFLEESSKYIDKNGCINIEKIENISQIFEKYFKFRNISEKKNKIKELLFFEHLNDISEEQLEEMANKLEPEFKNGTPKSGKRLTTIDKEYFSKYSKRQSATNLGLTFMSERKTISIFK